MTTGVNYNTLLERFHVLLCATGTALIQRREDKAVIEGFPLPVVMRNADGSYVEFTLQVAALSLLGNADEEGCPMGSLQSMMCLTPLDNVRHIDPTKAASFDSELVRFGIAPACLGAAA